MPPKSRDIEQKSSSVVVIFGATGDLARKRIFPALFKLSKNHLLPAKFKIIAAARTSYSNQDFIKYLEENIKIEEKKGWENFTKQIEYLPVDTANNLNLQSVSKKINEFEEEIRECPQRIFYMAILPQIFKQAITNLSKNNLHLGCTKHDCKPRVIVEKPFGYDLDSAREINGELLKYFTDDQIFRIDHYLGKETVQNIFAFRFANEIFEPVWNKDFIDHIQITVSEHIGVEKRGEFYEKTGALRDIIQNHMLQLMALIAMEAPEKFESKEIQQKKSQIIKSIKKLTSQEIESSTIRGQYQGYTQEEKINPASKIETYALLKLFIENKRWRGVPFYLRTGKKLPGKVTSIIIQFKEKRHNLFKNFSNNQIPNHITIQVQPNEGIGIRLAAKKPGIASTLEPVDMEFCYKTSFDVPQPEAYERLLLDVIAGDQTLFISQDSIEASWEVIDPIEKIWTEGKPNLVNYDPGSWGPKEAEEFIEKDGRIWLAPLLTICKI